MPSGSTRVQPAAAGRGRRAGARREAVGRVPVGEGEGLGEQSGVARRRADGRAGAGRPSASSAGAGPVELGGLRVVDQQRDDRRRPPADRAQSVSDRRGRAQSEWATDAAGSTASRAGPASSAVPSCSTIARVAGSASNASTPPARPRWSRSICDRDSGSRELNETGQTATFRSGPDGRPRSGVALGRAGRRPTYPVVMARSHLTLAALATSAVDGLDVAGIAAVRRPRAATSTPPCSPAATAGTGPCACRAASAPRPSSPPIWSRCAPSAPACAPASRSPCRPSPGQVPVDGTRAVVYEFVYGTKVPLASFTLRVRRVGRRGDRRHPRAAHQLRRRCRTARPQLRRHPALDDRPHGPRRRDRPRPRRAAAPLGGGRRGVVALAVHPDRGQRVARLRLVPRRRRTASPACSAGTRCASATRPATSAGCSAAATDVFDAAFAAYSRGARQRRPPAAAARHAAQRTRDRPLAAARHRDPLAPRSSMTRCGCSAASSTRCRKTS